MVYENTCCFIRMVLEYRSAVVYDETVYSNLVLGSIHILHRSLPFSWDLSQ
jgi:hypothetical protein